MRRLLLLLLTCWSVAQAQDGPDDPVAGPSEDLRPCWKDLQGGDNAACARCLAKAQRMWAHPSEAQQCELLALKGTLAQAEGDMDKAEALLNEALPMFLRGACSWKIGVRVLRPLGHLAYEQGDYHRALEHYRALFIIHSREEPPKPGNMGGVEYNIGNCYWGMDQRDSCRFHYRKALEYWRQVDTTKIPVMGYIYEVLGTYAWDEGDEASALAYFNLAGAHQLKNASGSDPADRLAREAEANAVAGKADEALRLYQQALELRAATFGRNNPNTACMHSDIARMLATIGRTSEALGRAQQAIKLFVPGFSPADDYANPTAIDSATNERLLLDALFIKFKLLAADHQNPRAVTSADELIDLSLRAIEHLRTGAQAEASKLFWTDHVRGFLEDALEHAYRHFDGSDIAAASRLLTIMEMGRNALLADALRSLDARTVAGLPDSIADEERRLKQHIAEMRRYIQLEEKKCEMMDADKVGLWTKAVAAGEADLARLVSRIATDFPAYHELKYAVSDIDPRAVLQRLGRERSLLCMFLGKDALYLLLLDDRGVWFVKEDHVAELGHAANELRGVLRDRNVSLRDPQGAYERFVESASLLHELVFRKLDPAPYAHLVIMPDGVFHYLPFDVLLVEKPAAPDRDYAKLHYLIKDRSVHVVSMLGPWLRERRERRNNSEPYFGVAPRYDAREGQGLPPLRSNVGEVEAAHALLGGSMLIGDQAGESGFKRSAGSAIVLHLAMHTVMDEAEPLQTALAFGHADSTNDGQLNMYELFGMELRAQLALLSACNTGAGPMLNGEGIMSMARAFQYTGCPSVVMNLWACDDDASGAIVAGLCERIRMGEELDDALREAKLQHLHTSDPMKAHPYYWSTLVLMGDERAIEPGGPWHWNAWMWTGAAALIFLLGWSFLRKRVQ